MFRRSAFRRSTFRRSQVSQARQASGQTLLNQANHRALVLHRRLLPLLRSLVSVFARRTGKRSRAQKEGRRLSKGFVWNVLVVAGNKHHATGQANYMATRTTAHRTL